ncbi:MAG: conjugal transfer protein TraX [Methylotenera sp.]|nr:MAG: conjugal transfer protein TraX [Methylotenera sp.]
MLRFLTKNWPLSLPRLTASSGAIECLKWLALIAMTFDHTNKMIFHAQFSWMYAFGRLAMPLFGFVLAYNLARPATLPSGIYGRVIMRTFFIGLVSTPVYEAAFQHSGLGALNIMFTLAMATGMIWLIDSSHHRNNDNVRLITSALAATIFVLGGVFVEGQWFGMAYILTAWLYCKSPNLWSLSSWLGGIAGLCLLNDNHWVLAAMPIIFTVASVGFALPRLKWAFYLYYPLHLAVLLCIHRIAIL